MIKEVVYQSHPSINNLMFNPTCAFVSYFNSAVCENTTSPVICPTEGFCRFCVTSCSRQRVTFPFTHCIQCVKPMIVLILGCVPELIISIIPWDISAAVTQILALFFAIYLEKSDVDPTCSSWLIRKLWFLIGLGHLLLSYPSWPVISCFNMHQCICILMYVNDLFHLVVWNADKIYFWMSFDFSFFFTELSCYILIHIRYQLSISENIVFFFSL